MGLRVENAEVFALASAALSVIGQSITQGHATELLLAFSCIFQMWEATLFTTLTISGTSSVDGFGYAPQFVFSHPVRTM